MDKDIKRIRLLKVWEILNRDTDEEHPLGTEAIIAKLAEEGIACVRTTLYEDIKTLQKYGYEIAIKSGKNPEGNRINRDCKEIRIFDCRCNKGHGITIGSEMSGGVSNVKIWDCNLENSYFGVEIKGTKKRGGYVRCVEVENCKMPRIMIHSVDYNDDGEGAETPPVFEDCAFTNLYLTGQACDFRGMKFLCSAVELQGFDVPGYEVKNIHFKNVTIETNGRDFPELIALRDYKAILFENIFYK